MDANKRLEEVNAYKPIHKMLPWSWLNNRANFVRKQVISEWNQLVNKKKLKEVQLNKFIATYPAFFLTDATESFFAISELRLGSDYVIDFVIPIDNRSRGYIYKIIEMELPSSILFKSNGDKSSNLNHAIDQIENWKGWIEKNQANINRIFPGVFGYWEDHFEFTIIIGNRENTKKWITKRNRISSRYKINIRSFDSLLDYCTNKTFVDVMSPYLSSEAKGLPKHVRNALVNPFYKTYSDKDWKKVVNNIVPVSHFVEFHADIFLQRRKFAEGLLSQLEEFCDNSPEQLLVDEHFSNVL